MSASTEARELELVGKVEMRIALAKDDKLEALLNTYLAPLLLKLGSEHLAVRNKVIATCQHIKIRLAGNQSIVLPVAALLKQYKDNADSSIIRHFDLLFVQQSIGKLSIEKQLDLLPILVHGLAQDEDKPTGATVFNLFLRILQHLKIPPRGSAEDGELRKKLEFDQHLADTQFVAAKFGQLVLLNLSKSAIEAGAIPPGLSKEQYDFLTLSGKPETWDPSSSEGLNLTETKIKCLNFLASGAFIDRERFVPALFASADSNSRISSVGEDLLKRSTVSLEDEDVVRELYNIYFTSRPALKTRILLLLTKSAAATNRADDVIHLMQDGVQPDTSTTTATGLEAVKFRNALFNFVNWVARMGSKSTLQRVAPSVIVLLKGYIEEQGWPAPIDKSANALSLRALAYEALGSIAKTAPSAVLDPDLALVNWLFRSLTEEGSSNSIFVSIEESLASLLHVFEKPLDPQLRATLCRLLLHYMTLEEGEEIVRTSRFTVVRWANRCLEFNDIVARWIDILAFGGPTNERSDVIEEGNKGLDPHWYRVLNAVGATESVDLPNWEHLVASFFTGQSILEESHAANSMKSGMEIDGVSVFGNFSGPKIKAFAPAVKYCRQMLLLAANQHSDSPLSIDAHWDRQLDVLLQSDKLSRQATKQYLKTINEDSLFLYLSAALEGMLWKDGEGLVGCSAAFVDIASLAPSSVIERLAARARDLVPAIKSNKIETRVAAAEAYGIIAPHPSVPADTIHQTLRGLLEDIRPWATAVGAEANRLHGYVLATGYLLSRAVFYGRVHEMDEGLVQAIIDLLLDIVSEARESTTVEAVLVALGQLATAGLLTEARISKSHSSSDLVTKLADMARKGDEKAIAALGRLTLGLDEAEEGTMKSILKGLYDLQEIRQAETQFAVGEALACASAGWDADCLVLSLDVDAPFHGIKKRDATLNGMLEKLIADSKTTKPSLQKATGIWLFCLVQYCGHLDEIQSRLRECQAAFMGLLSARDTLVQETASRGLSLVYEQGSKDLKDQLIKDLVSSFTGTNTQVKVDDDTELFDAGALPTGEGQSVTSYKDIMSLAAEVGDESLVYKFMSLASNAATWSTRAAFGRFGLSSIMSAGEVDPKLYPKLYRYCRDPNPNVQRSMNDIWSALVKDSSATIDKYFDDIMEGLLKDILGKEWRSRQASCAAIADLIQGRQFDKYEAYLNRVWSVAFKVLDDIKGSVRGAAMSLCKVLTAILVRQVEAGNSSKNAQSMVENVLPFLLSTQGLESTVKEVQVFALDTVLKLIKHGGKIILPFIPQLVEQMLGLLSTLERAEFNYLHLNAANYNLTEEAIDSARSSMVSGSPVMEAIERCLDLMDESATEKTLASVQAVIKTAVGMPSKVGCSGILVSLATRHSYQFRPHADAMLKVLEKAVLDRNATVSSAYARATGYVARLATDAALLKLANYCKLLYFRNEDDSQRQVAADMVYSVSKFATDRFNSLASAFLPFVFFAKHDFDKHVEEQFEKTWTENVGGSRAVLLYLDEIIKLCQENLESPKWAIKHTAALTIADVVKSGSIELTSVQAATIWPALDKALSLKTFEGKEKVLGAFVTFVKTGKSFWESNAAVSAQLTKIAIREAKRNNDAYRPHAFTTLGEYCVLRRDLNNFDIVYAIVEPQLRELSDDDRMDTKEDGKPSSTSATTLNAGTSALLKAINASKPDASPLKQLAQAVDVLTTALRSPDASIGTRTEIYERTKELLEALVQHKRASQDSHVRIAGSLFALLELPMAAGGEVIRMKRAEAAEALADAVKADVFGTERSEIEACKTPMLAAARQTLGEERMPGVKTVLGRVVDKLETW